MPRDGSGSLRRRRTNDAKETSVDGHDEEATYTLTRRVVSHHKHANDGWVIYNGGVYDVTMFIQSHPGGAAILIDHLGTDISELMHDDASHAHTAYALKMLEKHRIGDLASEEATVKRFGRSGDEQVKNGDTAGVAMEVNWEEPILHQVGMLGRDYFQWIHSFPTTDDTVKMFTNDTLESLTKCPWYVPLLFWVPIIVAECVHYVWLMGGVGKLNAFVIGLWSAVGFLCWLWFEYSLHRWVFHWKSSSYYGNIIHFLIHGHHHITPMDFDRLVFPPIPALMLASPFWYGAPRLLGTAVGYPWLIGFGAGYLAYDMTHFWIHHGIPSNKFLRQQKRRHVHHHYFQPNVNFGISNPLFDYVLGTIKEPAQ